MPAIRIDHSVLQSFLTDIFRHTGMPERDAAFCAWATVQSNLWGIDSHGVLRIPDYEMRLRQRVVNPTPTIVNRLPEEMVVGHLDADRAMGYVAGRAGMDLAIAKARRHGLSLVIVSNSNHNGAAGIYSRMAAEQGFLGLATTNVRPNIAMKGATAPATGNNPVSLAAPLPDHSPFCIDVSMSMVAQGKLILAAKKGVPIPTGWATDRNGVDTTDPREGLAGILLPIGDHKGFGLSLFIDLITGVLGGGDFLGHINSMYSSPDLPSNLSHLYAVLNPDLFMERDVFMRRLAEWRDMIKATPVRDGQPAQHIPGEPEVASEARRRREGIPVPDELWKDLEAIAGHYALAMPPRLESDPAAG
ncbi:MAG: Ldh family oxidoreductase [Planctomycetes bacterium]|nr:Ldh family oxidoreductase [Planctomycetota bacterium]